MTMSRFVFLLLLALTTVSPWAGAQSPGFYNDKTERFPMLTYEKFRSLRAEDQAEYLRVVQEFLVELEGKGVKTSWFLEAPTLLETMMAAGTPRAQANTEQCQLRRSQTGEYRYCLFCPSFPTATQMGRNTRQMVCGNSAAELSKNLADPSLAYPKFTAPGVTGDTAAAYQSYFEPQIKNLEDKGEAMTPIAGATIVKRDGVTKRIDSPAGEKIVRLDPEKPLETVDEAAPPTRIEKVEDGQVVETRTNTQGEKLGKKEGPSQEDVEKARAEAKKLKDSFMGELRCIYAGFPVLGNKCEGKSHFKSDKGGKGYTCDPDKAAEYFGDQAPATMIKPEPAVASKKILCNPMIFGLTKAGKPLCVAKGANATKSCLTEANKNDPEALKQATEIQKENPETSKQIIWILTKLCHGDDAVLKAFMQQKGSTNADKSVADIKSTCGVFGERFNQYYGQYQDGPRRQVAPTGGRR